MLIRIKNVGPGAKRWRLSKTTEEDVYMVQIDSGKEIIPGTICILLPGRIRWKNQINCWTKDFHPIIYEDTVIVISKDDFEIISQ